MRGLGHRLQLALLVAAVFVPCAVLIALSMRVVNQDRELRVKRQGDERSQLVAATAGKLRAAVEQISVDELRTDLEPGQRYRHSETAFVAWIEDGQLTLPWEPEHDRAARQARELVSAPAFESALRACGAGSGEPQGLARKIDCFHVAEARAKHPLQASYARWQLAENLQGAGEPAHAAVLFRSLLDADEAFTDADGIPLKLHAAQQLSRSAPAAGSVLSAVDSMLTARPWLTPMSMLMVSQTVDGLAQTAVEPRQKEAAAALREKATRLVRLLDQAQSLQNDFPRFSSTLQKAWMPYGDELWLVGAARGGQGSPAILAIRGADLFQHSAFPGVERFTDSREAAGEPIGDPFPGLKVVLSPASPPLPSSADDLQRRMLYLALLLAIVVTMFAAYLLWRDLRREVKASELRAQFVSSVSHELKTPLTAIRMFAETLQMGRCVNPEMRAEYLGTIVNECERLSRLVDGVLLFSKTEQGKKTYRFRPVRAADALQAAVRAMEYPLAEHGFRLHQSVDEILPEIAADRDALQQAVLNLLSNAMKFSGDSRDIELALYLENEEVVMRVTDYGLGIAPEEQIRIFEKFYRVPTRENELIPGTGLGLALVAQIARAHGGQVTLKSELGKGSTFYLRLPVNPGSGASL